MSVVPKCHFLVDTKRSLLSFLILLHLRMFVNRGGLCVIHVWFARQLERERKAQASTHSQLETQQTLLQQERSKSQTVLLEKQAKVQEAIDEVRRHVTCIT